MPIGGNPALEIFENVIAVSGVTTYYSAVTGSEEPKGTGIAYSLDYGSTWKFMPQPVVENPESGLYYQLEWGGQTIDILAVTTEVNNVTYDLAIDENYIYSTSWAGGLQRFDYTIENPEWEVIPLPMDYQEFLYCGEIDIDNYELNPKDPGDGGNHNHKGFSVYIDESVIWVGTANGLNKGTFDGDCINWTHITTSQGLSGNWVVGIESYEQITYAITWSTGSTEKIGLSYSKNNGENWDVVKYFTDNSIKLYNLKFDTEYMYASTIEGLYKSSNSKGACEHRGYYDHGYGDEEYCKDFLTEADCDMYSECKWHADFKYWEKYSQFIDVLTEEQVLDNSVYSSFISSDNNLWIGTGDGLAIIDENGNTSINRFWQNTESPVDGDFNFSVYPNPFYTKDYNVFNGTGHVRFISNLGKIENPHIDIFNFSMDHVKTLYNYNIITTTGEIEFIWDGKSSAGNTVANGVYFCKIQDGKNEFWAKLVVVN